MNTLSNEQHDEIIELYTSTFSTLFNDNTDIVYILRNADDTQEILEATCNMIMESDIIGTYDAIQFLKDYPEISYETMTVESVATNKLQSLLLSEYIQNKLDIEVSLLEILDN